jgi:putative heme-binding domain-containing protein
MYRFVVEHPRWITPERLKTLDIRAGADKGRIYRVYPRDKKPERIRNIATMKTIELVRRLNSPNGTERDRIQLELMRRKEKSSISGLTEIVQSRSEPAIRIQAFSAIESLDAKKASDLIAQLLADADSEVHAFAMSAAARLKTNEKELIAQNGDISARVALQLAFALGNNYDSSATKALAEILLKHGNDSWVRSAVLSSSAGRGLEIFEMVRSRGDAELLHSVARPLIATAINSGKDRARILRSVIPDNSNWEPWRLEAARQVLEDVAKDPKRRSKFLAEPGMGEAVDQILSAAQRIALDENSAIESRAAAVSLLGFDKSSKNKSILLELIANATAPQIQNAAAENLVAQDPLDEVVKEWSKFTPSARRALITASLKRAELVPTFLSYLEKTGSLGELSIAQKQQLKKHRREEIRKMANGLFPDSKSREQIIERYRSALAMLGNPENGSRLFVANCASCHLFRGQGYAVGPNLAALTDKSGPFLLTAILDPNAAVENRFVSYAVETKDGREVVGLVGEETSGSITVKLAGGLKESILRRDIQSLKASSLSLMPEGLEQNVSPQEIADLISFLQLGPAPFGSADASSAKRALATFQRTPFRVTSASEKMPYPSWLGRLALSHCRQTDGHSAVSWEVRPEAKKEVLRFPIALGFISNPSGSFELLVDGKPCLNFNVELDDSSWESKDKSVRLNYFVMERNEEDSNGILSVYLDPALVRAGERITFTVKGSASNSQRWFGVYELPQEVVSAKK